MLVYNISIKVSRAIEDGWIKWQKDEHIPEIMASGYFTDCKFYQLLEDEEYPDHVVYVVQYFAKNIEQYQEYIERIAPALRKKAFEKWGDQFIAFRTIMQSVD